MSLGHALCRYGRLQPSCSTAPMGLPQLNDKDATIQRAGCVFLDHVLVAIKNFRHILHKPSPRDLSAQALQETGIARVVILQTLQETDVARIFSFHFSKHCKRLALQEFSVLHFHLPRPSNIISPTYCVRIIFICILSCLGVHTYILFHIPRINLFYLQSQNSENESSVKWSRSHELELQSLGFTELVAIPVEIRGSVK